MNTFSLKILASNRNFFEGKCEVLVIPAIDGQMAIMAHHENMVVATEVGEIMFRDAEGNIHEGIVGIGFVHIANNRVTMLIDTAEAPDEIDEARAKAAMERAIEQLRQKQSIQEYHVSTASMSRAVHRLKSTEKFGLKIK